MVCLKYGANNIHSDVETSDNVKIIFIQVNKIKLKFLRTLYPLRCYLRTDGGTPLSSRVKYVFFDTLFSTQTIKDNGSLYCAKHIKLKRFFFTLLLFITDFE